MLILMLMLMLMLMLLLMLMIKKITMLMIMMTSPALYLKAQHSATPLRWAGPLQKWSGFWHKDVCFVPHFTVNLSKAERSKTLGTLQSRSKHRACQ